MSLFGQAQQIAFRATGKVLVRPAIRFWQTQKTIVQLNALAARGKGVQIDGTFELGCPQRTYFDDDVSINGGFVVNGEGSFFVGAHTHIGREVRVLTSNHEYANGSALPYDKTRLQRPVVIGPCVWIGDRVTIVPGVTIGEGAVLALGALVTKDVAPLAVVGGGPAKPLKSRDRAHYERLRDESRFIGWPNEVDRVNQRAVTLAPSKGSFADALATHVAATAGHG
jgi:acetyltransferase-like isoleucine patch superfamily enzyme